MTDLKDIATALFKHDQMMGLEYDGPGVAAFYEGEARWAAALGMTAESIRASDLGGPRVSQPVSGGGVQQP